LTVGAFEANCRRATLALATPSFRLNAFSASWTTW
jgi:hypothetical protein